MIIYSCFDAICKEKIGVGSLSDLVPIKSERFHHLAQRGDVKVPVFVHGNTSDQRWRGGFKAKQFITSSNIECKDLVSRQHSSVKCITSVCHPKEFLTNCKVTDKCSICRILQDLAKCNIGNKDVISREDTMSLLH